MYFCHLFYQIEQLKHSKISCGWQIISNRYGKKDKKIKNKTTIIKIIEKQFHFCTQLSQTAVIENIKINKPILIQWHNLSIDK